MSNDRVKGRKTLGFYLNRVGRMMLACILVAVAIWPMGVQPQATQAAPPPPTPIATPTPQPTEPGLSAQGATPPSPDHFPPEVEQARARQAMEAVLAKHLRYWGPRYQVAPIEVAVEGEWAHGVAQWQGEAKTLSGPIHILAHRSADGIWQALLPGGDGLYRQWVEAVSESLVPASGKGRPHTQTGAAEARRRPPLRSTVLSSITSNLSSSVDATSIFSLASPATVSVLESEESAGTVVALNADPKTTPPVDPTQNCWVIGSVQPQPLNPPTPFFYKPFDMAWSGSIWSANMDHTKPTYLPADKGSVASLGEILSTSRTSFGIYDYYLSPALEVLLGYDGHDGNDFAPPQGTTSYARAAAAGEVVRVQPNDVGPLGKFVDIYHPEGYLTRYGHLASVSVVAGASKPAAGDPIGVIGNTGTNTTGTHLHFAVYRWNATRQSWQITDPFGWDPWLSPGQQISDPLQYCNGEISYNLWFGGWPQAVDGSAGIAAVPNVRNIGGWLGDESPTPTPTQPPPGSWRVDYYNGKDFNSYASTDYESSSFIYHDWGTGSPGHGVGTDNFSIRYERTAYFNESGDWKLGHLSGMPS